MEAYALITGAAGGIGYEFAKLLARDRYHLLLVDKNRDELLVVKKELQAQYGVNVTDICCDLTAAGAVPDLFAKVGGLPVEILINNAGFGVKGKFTSTDWSSEYRMLQLHVVVLSQLTKLMAGPMLLRKKGYILNVASVAGFYPGPWMAVYYASKAYILSFSQAIGGELKGSGVTVTVLCPGPTKTGFQRIVGSEHSKLSRKHWLASPESVAAYGYRALLRKRSVAIPGRINRLLVRLAPLFGRRLKVAILEKLQRINAEQ